MTTHNRLMAGSAGYRGFVEGFNRDDPDDIMDLEGFADWLVAPGDSLDDFLEMSADDFRAEWNHWNS